MTSDSIMLLFDAIVLVYGAYLTYAAIQMQKTKQPPNLLVNQAELVGAHDIKGFCEAMYKPLLFFGVISSLYGILGLINDLYAEIPYMNLISIVIFLILCVWFSKQLKNKKKQYLK
ncbi:MAG: hypothetical protein PUD20_11100 [bacterium]|nr:hypothetical protein [bacterium]